MIPPQVWNMLCHLSSIHENGQSIVIPPQKFKHALSVVIIPCQRTEHCFNPKGKKNVPSVVIVSWQRSELVKHLRYERCSACCHQLMTIDRACLFISKLWNLLYQLSSSHENGQSMVFDSEGMKHAPSVVSVSWQRPEHGDTFSGMKHAPSDVIISWHRS